MSVLSMSPRSSAFSNNNLPTTPPSTTFSHSLGPITEHEQNDQSHRRSLRPRHLTAKSTASARIRSPYARPRQPVTSQSSTKQKEKSVAGRPLTSSTPTSDSTSAIPISTATTRKALLAAAAIAAGGEGTPGHVGARSGSLVRVPSAASKQMRGLKGIRGGGKGGRGGRGKVGSVGGGAESGSLFSLASVAEQENAIVPSPGERGGRSRKTCQKDPSAPLTSTTTLFESADQGTSLFTMPPGKMIWAQDEIGRTFPIHEQMIAGDARPVAIGSNPAHPSMSEVMSATGGPQYVVMPGPAQPSHIEFALPGVPLSQQSGQSLPYFHPQPQRRNPIPFGPAHLMTSTDPRAALSRSSTQMAPTQVMQHRQFTHHRIQPSFASSTSSRSTSASSATFPAIAGGIIGPAGVQIPAHASCQTMPIVKLEQMDLGTIEGRSKFEEEYYTASVPLSLPMPPVMEVDVMNLADEDLAQIPLPYILASLRSMSTNLFASSNLYKPSPFHASDAATQQSKHGLPNHMRWTLGEERAKFAAGSELSKGMEPTHVLAVKGMQGREVGGENKGRLILIHHLIYAAQCVHFPGLHPADGTNRSISSLDTITTASSEASMSSTIVQDYAQQVGRGLLNGDEASSSRRSSIESGDGNTGADKTLLREAIDLPLLHLTVPTPSMMPILHTWLYIQQPQVLLTNLLDMPTPSARPAPSINVRLAALGMVAILARLKRVHGLWQNVVCLGISDKDLWKVMQTGWKLLVAALQAQGQHAPESIPSEEQRTTE